MILSLLSLLAAHASAAPAPALQPRDGATAVVDFSNNTGTPAHLAAGFIYGIPDTADQIPDNFYTGMGFNYARAGGAQLPAPARGWIWGMNEYQNRFQSVLSNYQTTRKYGGTFIFLPHDLWGADGNQNSSAPYPGDNGDWSFYDQFLEQVFSDFNANGMTEGLVWDIWNEPDGGHYWIAPQSQYLEMWGRTFPQIQANLGNGVQTSGPSSSNQPSLSYDWWTNFASFIESNGTVPDQWTWHEESGGSTSMNNDYNGLQQILQQYNLPQRLVNINEYGIQDEQCPCGSAWWISQLERYNAVGLRGNWLSSYQLHDFMANLVSKPGAPNTYSATGTGYYPVGEYQVYEYYTQNMTGYRVGTTISSDFALDTYATVDTDAKRARILCGIRLQTGTWYVQLNSLSSLGLPTSGTLNIHTYSFGENNGQWGEVDSPDDLGYYGHDYSGDSVTFPIYQSDQITAYAFDFALP